MGDISRHISRSEAACKCHCGFDAVDFQLVYVIETMMDHFEREKGRRLQFLPTSWNRCYSYNGGIPGAASNSKHTKGIAVDFTIQDIYDDDIADYLEKNYRSQFGIGRYDGRTHLDMRRKASRWDERS